MDLRFPGQCWAARKFHDDDRTRLRMALSAKGGYGPAHPDLRKINGLGKHTRVRASTHPTVTNSAPIF